MSRSKMPWRKLLTDPPSDWQRMPLLTRGVGDEVLRALDSDGEIQCGAEAPAAVVCRLTGAHPRERRRVAEALDELDAAGFLSIGGGVIRGHFPDLAARPRCAPSAQRDDVKPTRSEREADVKLTRSQPEVSDNHPEPFTSDPVEKRREEERRGEREDPERAHEDRRWIPGGGPSAPIDMATPVLTRDIFDRSFPPSVPFDPDPEPPRRPSREPAAVVRRLFAEAYLAKRATPWAHNAWSREIETFAQWADAQARADGVELEHVVGRVIAAACADSYLVSKDLSLSIINRQLGALYKPPPKAAARGKILNTALIRDAEECIAAEKRRNKPNAEVIAAAERSISAERACPSGEPPEPSRARAGHR